MAERATISAHEVRIYQYIKTQAKWLTVSAIAQALSMPRRTVGLHVRRLADLRVLYERKTYPGWRYKLAPRTDANAAYCERLQAAAETFTA